MQQYIKSKTIGEGTWGVVYEASRKKDNLIVAIKRIKNLIDNSNNGVSFSALREVKYLRELNHNNIISLLDVYLADNSLHLVFEWCVTDLEVIIKKKNIFLTPSDIKSFLLMSFTAIDHCHQFFILHRDIKPSNFLISSNGVLKLSDFGLARFHGSAEKKMTHEVVTSWYRAPELYFGTNQYSFGVDMWAMGCVMAELILRTPLFPGKGDIEQLSLIFNCFGTPISTLPNNEEKENDNNENNDNNRNHSIYPANYWPGVESLPKYIPFEERTAEDGFDFATLFSSQQPEALSLFYSIMIYEPSRRISSHQCLTHPYFLSTLYPPTEPVDLPLPSGLAGQSNGIDSDDELNINYTQNETNTKKRMLEYQQKLEQKRRDRAAGNIVKKLKIEDR